MYLDEVVLSGIIILVLTCLFMVAVVAFAWRHIRADMATASGVKSSRLTEKNRVSAC